MSTLVSRLRYAVPQWQGELKSALQRAKQRLAHARVDGVDWYWPANEQPPRSARADEVQDAVRLLAPFDPVVWDRRRFELFWGWAYRFEAYTPLRKRKLGYYALPLLWRDRVIGWGNLSLKNGELQSELGYVASRPPRDRASSRASSRRSWIACACFWASAKVSQEISCYQSTSRASESTAPRPR